MHWYFRSVAEIRNFWRWLNFRLFVSCQLTQSRPFTSPGMLVPLICSFYFDLLSCQCTYCTTHIIIMMMIMMMMMMMIVVVVVIVLQDISGEHLNRGSNKAQNSRLDIHAYGFWERHRSAFFDVRICPP